ncbi:hypothetical protein ZWY2020_057070 [Hordeum vulgare]|nr:hypothetical protein ZWY2020_057070 [Hordeum vulgare]
MSDATSSKPVACRTKRAPAEEPSSSLTKAPGSRSGDAVWIRRLARATRCGPRNKNRGNRGRARIGRRQGGANQGKGGRIGGRSDLNERSSLPPLPNERSLELVGVPQPSVLVLTLVLSLPSASSCRY